MKINQLNPIGSFEFISGKAYITDPCYYEEDHGEGISVKIGHWETFVYIVNDDDWGQRCAILIAHHKDHPVQIQKSGWIYMDAGTAVDSGQAGFFDAQFFNDPKVVTEKLENPLTGKNLWYDLCCNRTLDNDLGAGIIPFGVVSSTGYGDGYYPAYAQYEGDEIVALGLEFQILPPIFFIPEFDKGEEKLFDLIEMEDLSLEAFLISHPEIDLKWFVNHCVYTHKIKSLKTLLPFDVGMHDVDLAYLIGEDDFEVFEAIQWEINQVIELSSFLSLIYWKSVDLSIKWSALILNSSLKIKETSYDSLFLFASRLQDEYLPLVVFWVEKGLKGYDTEFTAKILEIDFKEKPAIKQYLLDNLSSLLISSNSYLNKRVEVLEGPFSNFQGMVINIDGQKLTVVVNIFGRDTEVPLDVKQVKLLD